MSIESLAQDIVNSLKSKNQRAAFAESCTGGMVSAAITSVPGSSRVLDLSIVTYSNQAKIEYTDVTQEVLGKHSAVSSQTAQLMAQGIRARANADIGIGITGIAGPDGGTDEKPVGTVYIAVNDRIEHCVFTGDRQQVREQTTRQALEMLHDCILQTPPCQRQGI
jgi:PncC family amidohydrolase